MVLSSNTARALDFDFTFVNDPVYVGFGTSTDTVSGTIFGLQDNTTSSASSVVITAYASDLYQYLQLSAPILTTQSVFSLNRFTVVGGVITDWDYQTSLPGNRNVFQITSRSLSPISVGDNGLYYADGTHGLARAGGLNEVLFTEAAVPEPPSVPIFVLGLLALAAVGCLQQRPATDSGIRSDGVV